MILQAPPPSFSHVEPQNGWVLGGSLQVSFLTFQGAFSASSRFFFVPVWLFTKWLIEKGPSFYRPINPGFWVLSRTKRRTQSATNTEKNLEKSLQRDHAPQTPTRNLSDVTKFEACRKSDKPTQWSSTSWGLDSSKFARWWRASNIFLFSPRQLGNIFTHFDDHIFQMGLVKNHQL